jgi:hypothetical protein
MNDDIIKDAIEIAEKYAITNWEETVKLYFGKYFLSKKILEDNHEALQINIINYIRLQKNNNIFALFEWTVAIFQEAINKNKLFSLNILNDYLSQIYETDFRWTSMVTLQNPIDGIDERDLIKYKFGLIEEILETMFNHRFELLYVFSFFLENGNKININNITFGELINSFPKTYTNKAQLYLQDPLFSISTNQWRNISAHKTFKVQADKILVYYGKNNKYNKTLSYEEFDIIVDHILAIYNAIRLAEIITYFNYTPEIGKLIGLKVETAIRLDTFLFEMIFNMKLIGFKFVSTSQKDRTFSLTFQKREKDTLQYSLMLVSQCLERVAYYISLDQFDKEKYTHVCANIMENNMITGFVKVDIQSALNKVYGIVTFEEYVNHMIFSIQPLEEHTGAAHDLRS